MKAHLVQMDLAWEDRAANHATAWKMVEAARPVAGDLVLLPEMFDTGFSMNTARTADDGSTLAFLGKLAREFRVVVQGGRTTSGKAGGKASNVMTVVDSAGAGATADGGLGLRPGPLQSVAAEKSGTGQRPMPPTSGQKPQPPNTEDFRVLDEYAKIHPFSLGQEHTAFEGGSRVTTWRWEANDTTVCPAICYDLRFPELFRIGLAKGAEAYALGACWPKTRQHHWRALLIARAIENQAFVLGVNRVGVDPNGAFGGGLEYAGGSMVVGSTGEVVGELGAEAGVLSVEVDIGAVRRWREKFPAWMDRKLGLPERRLP